MLALKFSDLFLAQESKELQITDHVPVVGANPELVKLVNAGLCRVEVDGSAEAPAEFGAVRVSDERASQPVNMAADFAAREVDTRGDVTPLVAPPNLQFTVVI